MVKYVHDYFQWRSILLQGIHAAVSTLIAGGIISAYSAILNVKINV